MQVCSGRGGIEVEADGVVLCGEPRGHFRVVWEAVDAIGRVDSESSPKISSSGLVALEWLPLRNHARDVRHLCPLHSQFQRFRLYRSRQNDKVWTFILWILCY